MLAADERGRKEREAGATEVGGRWSREIIGGGREGRKLEVRVKLGF